MSLIAQIEARPELTLEEIREIAREALFHAELRTKVPADATREECYEYIRWAEDEIEEYNRPTEYVVEREETDMMREIKEELNSPFGVLKGVKF